MPNPILSLVWKDTLEYPWRIPLDEVPIAKPLHMMVEIDLILTS
jgi:hypothetical protein